MYQNRATLIGFLGKDAEVKITRNNASFTVLSLATKRTWKDRESGELHVRDDLAPLYRLGQARRIRRHAHQGRTRSGRGRHPHPRVHAEGKRQEVRIRDEVDHRDPRIRSTSSTAQPRAGTARRRPKERRPKGRLSPAGRHRRRENDYRTSQDAQRERNNPAHGGARTRPERSAQDILERDVPIPQVQLG